MDLVLLIIGILFIAGILGNLSNKEEKPRRTCGCSIGCGLVTVLLLLLFLYLMPDLFWNLLPNKGGGTEATPNPPDNVAEWSDSDIKRYPDQFFELAMKSVSNQLDAVRSNRSALQRAIRDRKKELERIKSEIEIRERLIPAMRKILEDTSASYPATYGTNKWNSENELRQALERVEATKDRKEQESERLTREIEIMESGLYRNNAQRIKCENILSELKSSRRMYGLKGIEDALENVKTSIGELQDLSGAISDGSENVFF